MTPTEFYSNSVEITLRHGNHSANSPLTFSKKTDEGLLLKRESYLWKNIYIYIYIYIHNTNMMKYCAINLNERYRFSFKYSRDNSYVFSRNIIDFLQHMYLHWHYFIKNSSRWSLKMWKNWKYFNGTAISTFSVLMKAVVLVILALNLNVENMLLFGSSFWYCHKLPDVFTQLLLYSIILWIGTNTFKSFAISTCV